MRSSRRASASRPASSRARPSRKRSSALRGSFATARRSGGMSAGESTSVVSARYGSTDSGSSRRAQRRLSRASDGRRRVVRPFDEAGREPRRREREEGGEHCDDAGGNRDAAGQRRRIVLRQRDAGDEEHRQPDRGDRPHPVASRVDREIRRRPERAGRQERASRAAGDAEQERRSRSDHEQEADDAGLRERVELERVGAVGCLEALPVDEVRVPPAVRADAGERVTLELVPGDEPEVVTVRAERTEVGRRGRVGVELPELVPAVLRRAYGVLDGRRRSRRRPPTAPRTRGRERSVPPRSAPRPEREAAGRRGHTRDRRACRCPRGRA